MANVKEVLIVAEVPNFFLHGEPSGKTTDAEAAGFARSFLTPSFGLRLSWSPRPVRQQKNSHGGVSAIYRLTIEGVEAVSERWLEGVRAVLERDGGRVTTFDVADLEI